MEYELIERKKTAVSKKPLLYSNENKTQPIRLNMPAYMHCPVIQRVVFKVSDREEIVDQLVSWEIAEATASQLYIKMTGVADGTFELDGKLYQHVSRGAEGKAGGATAFYRYTEDGKIDLVGVGQHDGTGVTNRLSRYKLTYCEEGFRGNISKNILDIAKKDQVVAAKEEKVSSRAASSLEDENDAIMAEIAKKAGRHAEHQALESRERRERFQKRAELYDNPGCFKEYTFFPRHPHIHGEGLCFWDSLRYIGFKDAHLQEAAVAAGLRHNAYVTIDSAILDAFFTRLQTLDRRSLRIGIVNFKYGCEDQGVPVYGFGIRGGSEILEVALAIFTDPDEQGHFVPAGGF